MPRKKRAELPVYLSDFYNILRESVTIGKQAKRRNVIAVAGKVVITDNEQKHTRWNNQAAANQVTAQEQEVQTLKRDAVSRQVSLTCALADLEYGERYLETRVKKRDESGHSVVRLDTLKAWVKEHMPSVLAMATEGPLLRLRFCAAATRGAGNRAGSPNRYLVPPTWITINVDTGIVEEARSDGSRGGAMHPHARADNGNVCTGKAIRQPRRENRAATASTIKIILSEVEKWRLVYGDDCFEPPRWCAGKVWEAVAAGRVTFEPVQGTTGMVYKNMNTLLQAEPWDGSAGPAWCQRHDFPMSECGCCISCGATSGDCRCGNCLLCGRTQGHVRCRCCAYCESTETTWNYRGDGNEHQVCGSCGYCRLCDSPDCTAIAEGDWRPTLWFLTPTDIGRVRTLATLEYGRGAARPPDYSSGCNCGACRTHTRHLAMRDRA